MMDPIPERRSWTHIKQRCYNPRNRKYPHYGGRGIRMCDRWLNSFAAFAADMGPRPSPKHSIDRIDVNGNYEPGNCRWATVLEQARNNRRTVNVTAFGRTQCIAAWASELGLDRVTLARRIAAGLSVEAALTIKPSKTNRWKRVA